MSGLLLLEGSQLSKLLQARACLRERILRHSGQCSSTGGASRRPVRQRQHGLVELRV